MGFEPRLALELALKPGLEVYIAWVIVMSTLWYSVVPWRGCYCLCFSFSRLSNFCSVKIPSMNNSHYRTFNTDTTR